MLVKMMVTLAVTMVLTTGIGTFHIKDMKNIVADSDKQNMLCTIDEALIRYYYTHSGQLPSSLNDVTLKITGMNDSGWKDYSYSVSGNKFTLSTVLKNGTTAKSPNSDKVLSDIYDEDSNVKIK